MEGGAELGVKQAVRRVKTLQGETASDESYERRQMWWEGMSGKSCRGQLCCSSRWVPEVESLQLQKSIATVMRGVGPCTAGRLAMGGVYRFGQGQHKLFS